MRIVVAGAGAGKTTSLAEEVLRRYKLMRDGKFIYVITYTNAARDHIRNKIIELSGSIPNNVKIVTSHVFLLHEIIFPFNHLLYGQLFNKASILPLPSNHVFKSKMLKELRAQKIIHSEEVTEIAKYILVGKSSDKKLVKDKREKLLVIIGRYLDSIYIDEVQDIDSYMSKIIDVLYQIGINLYLVGDPKQDLRGNNELRKLMAKYSEHVEYKTENYRCPISHVNFVNNYVLEAERQECQTIEVGSIHYLFETDIVISDFIKSFEHVYIYQKNGRFLTNQKEKREVDRILIYELKRLIQKSKHANNHLEKQSYELNKWIQSVFNLKKDWDIINKIGEILSIKLTSEDQARMFSAMNKYRQRKETEGVAVDSIDKVKGLEGESCLFILSTELAEYFFLIKTNQNKMLNYLYVALTRSKKELYILITRELEEQYGREWIISKMNGFLESK